MWTSDRSAVRSATQIDWARLAAYIDSEGHIRCVMKGNRPPSQKKGKRGAQYIQVTISNTDPRLMIWLEKTFGGTYRPNQSHHKNSSNWKVSFHWDVASSQAAEILRGCFPYFVIKQQQAEIAIAFADTMRRSGVKGTPQHVLDTRRELQTKLRVLTARGPAKAVNE